MAITDLTNTTWEIPAGWTATAGYGVFDIIYNISFGNVNYNNMSKLGIGYTSSDPPFDMLDVAVSDTIQIYPELSVILYGDSITFTFTGGTDATNPNLISWLEANGTLQGGETEQTDTKLYIGTKAVQSMSIGNKEILKMYVGNSLVYEKASGSSEYTVTISLTNPLNSQYFSSGEVYDNYEDVGNLIPSGNVIGTFTSPTDTITVKTTTGKLCVRLGTTMLFASAGTSTTTGDISLASNLVTLFATTLYRPFNVASDGTITLNGVDYMD